MGQKRLYASPALMLAVIIGKELHQVSFSAHAKAAQIALNLRQRKD